jgi:hypothetical protein
MSARSCSIVFWENIVLDPAGVKVNYETNRYAVRSPPHGIDKAIDIMGFNCFAPRCCDFKLTVAEVVCTRPEIFMKTLNKVFGTACRGRLARAVGDEFTQI